jgi:serine/threonine protein kinase
MQAIDNLKIIRSLGEGGFGTTTLVERDGKRYVLKRLKESAIAQHGQAAIDLFLQESEYLRQLGDHPQIPALIDSGVDESPWILQEYIAGENLEQILEKHTFSEAEIITLLKSVLPVLQTIHSYRTIHRDIKPANIIFADNDYHLVDFGASKKVSETVLAKTGTMIGSAIYAAPEQVYGHATFASDIFGLGVTCIHLLTGVPPSDLMDRVNAGKWCWRDYLGEGRSLSHGLSLILDRMLEYSTHRRYGSADEVLSDLGRIDRYVVRSRRVAWVNKQKKIRSIRRFTEKTAIAIATVGAIAIVAGISVWGFYSLMQMALGSLTFAVPSDSSGILSFVQGQIKSVALIVFIGFALITTWVVTQVVINQEPLIFIVRPLITLGIGAATALAIAKLIFASLT